jgi:hypothetical protein
VLQNDDSIMLRYDGTSQRWRATNSGHDIWTPSTPSRALNTTFTPSTTNFVHCIYTIQLVETPGQDGTVELRSDTASPPTTVRCSGRSAAGALLGASVTNRTILTYVCPPGDNVRIVTSGTGTFSIVNQTEEQIG